MTTHGPRWAELLGSVRGRYDKGASAEYVEGWRDALDTVETGAVVGMLERNVKTEKSIA